MFPELIPDHLFYMFTVPRAVRRASPLGSQVAIRAALFQVGYELRRDMRPEESPGWPVRTVTLERIPVYIGHTHP